jgi:hypothetical protein
MNYIKMFIKTSKKEIAKNSKSKVSEKSKEILGDYIENLFDDIEFVEKYFEEYFIYSENFLKEKINDKVDINNLISELSKTAADIDSTHKYDYYKRIFLLEFLAKKMESN